LVFYSISFVIQEKRGDSMDKKFIEGGKSFGIIVCICTFNLLDNSNP